MAKSVSTARAVACLALLSVVTCHPAPNWDIPAVGTGSRDIITADEIAPTNAANAYEIIRKLRATFLSYRGATSLYSTSSPQPTVYLDDMRYGPMPILATIPAQDVASIRLYRAWEATTKFGTGNMGGVIAVYTKH